jgi:hypothetical protein
MMRRRRRTRMTWTEMVSEIRTVGEEEVGEETCNQR